VVALAVHAETGFQVWFMPCYAHRFGKEMAAPAYRLKMCELITRSFGSHWFKTSPFEIEQKHNGSTYELFDLLKDQHKETHRFHLVMGMDNWLKIEEWDRGMKLVTENPVILLRRPGYSEAGKIRDRTDHLKLVDLHFPGASSTSIRDAIREKNYLFARRQVYSEVWDFVRSNGLYGYGR